MYKCYDCGSEFMRPRESSWSEHHEFWGAPVSENVTAYECPDCGSEDIEEGYDCVYCEAGYAENDGELCGGCKEKLIAQFSEFKSQITKETGLSEAMFNEYLENWLLEL